MTLNCKFLVDSEHSPAIILTIVGLAKAKASEESRGLLDIVNADLLNIAGMKQWLKTVGTQRHLLVNVAKGKVRDIVLCDKRKHYIGVEVIPLLRAVKLIAGL